MAHRNSHMFVHIYIYIYKQIIYLYYNEHVIDKEHVYSMYRDNDNRI